MIRVQGLDYWVEIVTPRLSPRSVGETDLDNQEIVISSDVPLQKQQQVMVHELVHVWLYPERQLLTAIGDAESEGLVTRLANMIYETLVTNDLLREDWWERIIDALPEEDGAPEASSMNVTEKDDNSPLRTVDRPTEDPLFRPVRDEGIDRPTD